MGRIKDLFVDLRVRRTMALAGTQRNLVFHSRVPSVISELSERFGSDKASTVDDSKFAWLPHQYGAFYDLLLGGIRHEVSLVFECGIGTTNPLFPSNMGHDGVPGASLRMWREYFPNAHIIGADIDPNVLISEERISSFLVDQTDRDSIQLMWDRIGKSDFDLMVDDGLHSFSAAASLFRGSHERLKPGGLYVVEDVRISSVSDLFALAEGQGFSATYINFGRQRYGPNAADGLVIMRRPLGR